MNKVSENDLVEILDNGVHLGWADVVAGKWNFSLANVPVGSRNLTAKYKNKESQRWEVIVKAPPRFDDFNDARPEATTFLQRPLFTVSYEVQGSVGRPSPMYISRIDSGLGPQGSLHFYAVQDSSPENPSHLGNYSLVVSMVFKDVYSSISFFLRSVIDYAADKDLIVASDEFGSEVDSFDVRGMASNRPQTISLHGKAGKKIKRLTFFLVPSVPPTRASQLGIHIDDLVMQP